MRKISKNGHEFFVDETWRGEWWADLESGQWEPYTFTLMDRLLSREVSYVDIGAWIGPTVLYAAGICQQCYAIEPDPVAYQQLRRNIDVNHLENIMVINEAIFGYDGTLTMGSETLGDSMTRISYSGKSFCVVCETIESLVERKGIADPIFIKMDVEGSEEFILKSLDFFEKRKPTLYVSLHSEWFKNQIDGMETIRKVGRLYQRCYDVHLNVVDINGNHGAFVFTDRLEPVQ